VSLEKSFETIKDLVGRMHVHDRITECARSRTLQFVSHPAALVQPFIGADFSKLLSDFQRRLSGTRCRKQFSSATLSTILNLDSIFFILSGFHCSLIRPAASASGVWSYNRTVWRYRNSIAPFAITINSNVCPHIRVLNTLMRESYAWRHRNTLFLEHI